MKRLLLLALLAAAPAAASELKVATWNLDWLTDRPAGDPALPPDLTPKRAEDVALLRRYAVLLAADVVALEEVDGEPAAARLFPPDRYAIHMTDDAVVQRVGIAVRRGLAFTANPDVTALDVTPHARHPLRSGADITLDLPGGRLRVLAVHLKSGCRESLDAPLPACSILRTQAAALERWIAARRAEDMPFVILGDFGHVFDAGDTFWATLAQAAPLARATEGKSNPCWGGGAFTDHILAGGAARGWMDPATLRVLVYRETDAQWRDRLSGHCPVSVRLHLPDAK